MPAFWFRCPDGESIEIEACLKLRGCRMEARCANLPYLRMIGYDREWRGITPSMAGSGPLMIALKKTKPYTISPDERTFSALGVGVHGKLSIHKYTYNVLSEETLSDDDMMGIADVLEQDEDNPGGYVLEDYKTWGSYKVAKALGITMKEVEVDGVFKSGPRKGKPRTEKRRVQDPSAVEMLDTELQLNKYAMFFEKAGFPVTGIRVIAIVRDGGTQVAESRGITRNLYVIPVKRLDQDVVIGYYDGLRRIVFNILGGTDAPLCSAWECWEGRRCKGYCEVASYCKEITKRPDNWRG